jgi:glutamate synthase (NADPH/NADH) large chain/glutamate synthase (ferredoxin)
VGFVARSGGQASHDIVEMALTAVVNLSHRGALDADAKTGDGAGALFQIPRRFFVREAEKMGLRLAHPDQLAVGMLFVPQDREKALLVRRIVEERAQGRGLTVLSWRQVPLDPSVLGDKARSTCPSIWQVLLAPPTDLGGDDYERRLYLTRKEIEAALADIGSSYVASFSHRTIVYKGLLVAKQLRGFYPDLQDSLFESALAVFHQRYSTNTFPTWPLAQPFRFLGHNGEINTLQGNVNWMRAREPELKSRVWGSDIEKLKPIIIPGGSDSAMLDNVMEALVQSGRGLLHAMLMLVPSSWERMPDLDPAWRDFYEYHACLMEPWDGPAALAFSDGRLVGAALDRNGLRPLRYKIADDGLVVAASEVGLVDMDEARVMEKGRLTPGEIIVVDTDQQRILKKPQVMAEVVDRRPYGAWVRDNIHRLGPAVVAASDGDGHREGLQGEDLGQLQSAFAWTNEDVKMILRTMAAQGHDPVWSMGDDTPLAVLSQMRRPLWTYFRQRFAQVTNPAIDSLREDLVMSLDCYLGPRQSIFEETEEHARLIHHDSPLLTGARMRALKDIVGATFRWKEISVLFPVVKGIEGIDEALQEVCASASRAVAEGDAILILSDRGVDAEHAALPMLLAVGAVHHQLIRQGQRMKADLVVETGAVWDVHHLALLLGYGANGVYPYLALATAHSMAAERDMQGTAVEEIEENFRQAMGRGLLKIMSKMGISALRSYRGAQIFEIVGLAPEVADYYFTGTPARLGGIGLREIAEDVLHWHREAMQVYPQRKKLPDIGYVRFRQDGEYHGFNPEVVRALHRAVQSGVYEAYRQYSELVHGGPPRTLRDILQLRSDRPPIAIEEVEPTKAICRCFVTAAMSMGALSQAAHKAIAVAMNRLGGRSNTGEGGEDRRWYEPLEGGDWANSRIKQVASARFGVTTEYLAMADELEIKIAQGSKPGEGGQLPGHKVTSFIAEVRHAIPGIPLISPPPHHDIYSIEDIAQLIYDLKQVNPRARVGVKLVAESGVGTIAAGVAKAYADYIQISGADGGTGASPLSSIKNAGCPWELGLAETQQVLMMNGLRGRVRLRTDGGLKTGRDVVMAALLGADEFGFGTAAIVGLGCDMARQCHLNTCPTGIATQRPDLIEKKFTGTPERVVNFFTFVAQEVREILAFLGYRSLEEIVGRVDLLEPRGLPPRHRGRTLTLEAILADVDPAKLVPRRCSQSRNDRPYPCFDEQYLSKVLPSLGRAEACMVEVEIRNSDLTAGARIAGMVAERYGLEGLPSGTIEIRYRGSAGQSFGAWCVSGMRVVLEGEANDYLGKGLSGGEIIVRPPPNAPYKAHENVIVGNVCLYGATGGRVFVAGRAGERFAVRNSGATAVVEGADDHCCEYMTHGIVVVLGSTGRNFAAGMSWGNAYVLDEDGSFPHKYNPELVKLERVTSEADEAFLRSLIRDHVDYTGSQRSRQILEDWPCYLPLFWKVVPLSVPMDVMGHAVHRRDGREPEKAETPAQKPGKA